jgi:outer membrane protein assembly factor BamB
MRGAKRFRHVAVCVSIALGTSFVTIANPASAAASCAPSHAGGEWASYGQDLTNGRNQLAETSIGPGNVAALMPAWSLSARGAGGAGAFQSTPVVADGCLFAGTQLGSLFAVNADTGETVWTVLLPAWGGIQGIFAPVVSGGVVYAAVANPLVPYVTALDEATGATLWTTFLYQGLLFDGDISLFGVNASMVLFDGMLFVPVTGSETSNLSHPSYYLIDARDGKIVKKTTVIPRDDQLLGYAGGSIWTTAAVDARTKYLYVGTANPQNHRMEHDYSNSLLKIDVDRTRRATFGQIVGNYKGDFDYTEEAYDTTECRLVGDYVFGLCGQRDIDFGASPSVFTTSDGRTIVANLQKSCTYHAVDASTMQGVWKHHELAEGGASGCASTSAYDDTSVYVNVNGSTMFAFDKDSGAIRWQSAYGDLGTHYQPVTVANGVVYTLGNNGHLYAFGAEDGAILVDRQLAGPGGDACGGTAGAGLSIARNMVYAACDALADTSGAPAIPFVSANGGVFAYKL